MAELRAFFLPPLSGARLFFYAYPPFLARVRSPSGWAKLSSRLAALHFRNERIIVA